MTDPDAIMPLSPTVVGLLDAIDGPAILLAPDYRILAANRAYRCVYNNKEVVEDCAFA